MAIIQPFDIQQSHQMQLPAMPSSNEPGSAAQGRTFVNPPVEAQLRAISMALQQETAVHGATKAMYNHELTRRMELEIALTCGARVTADLRQDLARLQHENTQLRERATRCKAYTRQLKEEVQQVRAQLEQVTSAREGSNSDVST